MKALMRPVATHVSSKKMTLMSYSSAIQLMTVHFAAERPWMLRLESRWLGRVGLCPLIDQDPTFGLGLLVASVVPSLSSCQCLACEQGSNRDGETNQNDVNVTAFLC